MGGMRVFPEEKIMVTRLDYVILHRGDGGSSRAFGGGDGGARDMAGAAFKGVRRG